MSSSKGSSKRTKFAELRALRQSGKKTFDAYEVEKVDSLYEEVDEDSYKKLVRERLNQDDFVVDDNGEGYADDGREDWDRVPVYDDSESDGAAPRKTGKSAVAAVAGKRARDEDRAKRDANDRDISEYFSKGAPKAQQKPKAVKTEDDDKFLADLLGEVDSNTRLTTHKSAATKPAERRKGRPLSPGPSARQPRPKKAKTSDSRRALPPRATDNTALSDDEGFVPAPSSPGSPGPAPLAFDDDVLMSDPVPSSPAFKAAARKSLHQEGGESGHRTLIKKEVVEEDDEDTMEVSHAGAIASSSVNLAASKPAKKALKPPAPEPSRVESKVEKDVSATEELDSSSWTQITQGLNVVSSLAEGVPAGKMDAADAVEEDGSLRMFWLDYAEVMGSLCLFGKVLNKKTKLYTSCFVKVDNILRKLYFLPRQFRVRQGEEHEDESVGMQDVYGEVDGLMTKMGVDMHKIKACSRKYAFELPDVPREGQYLKCLYPYTKRALDGDQAGETYSHVFGTNTSLFEQFVLWKNIMGPCWLKIEDANFSAVRNASHCRLEVLAEHPAMISTLSEAEAPDPPPLTVMSMALRTKFNAKENKQEVLAISGRVYEQVSLAETAPADKLACRTFTVIRPADGQAFPVGFEALAKDRRRPKGVAAKTARNELDLLSFFLAQVDKADPDVVVGHQLEGADYSVLLSRLQDKKVHQWSRLGRLRRSQWPASMGRTGGNVFAERQVMAGRLLCDLANDMGKSVMPKCQSWGLTEMCSLYLAGAGRRRLDVDSEVALRTWAATRDGLVDYLAHMEADTYLMAALALRTQILPLTKVLTNLAGNSWARTLTGTRAERNEYILLHEFHRSKYVCPDKPVFRGREARVVKEEDEDEAKAGGGKKKDKYKGGLVFEPEKGLYDKFVLVMDFNSLYPSIIQEFNICFTTVDRSSLTAKDEDEVPEVPSAKLEQGILPRLIATLVSRRRQVKALMKDKTATAEELATWDVKQQALKLTANSMYGCLGFDKSRFYARPLAVLTTYKGREILRSTKELAESNALQVIYGDTDSVMINANVDSYAAARRVGIDFKRAVNERYRLLEIDIDNVFRRILLQAKKKYAAVNLIEVDGRLVEKMEVKGLDMRRREYCALSKEVSAHILSEILSGDETEASVARIHEYLRDMAARMRAATVPPQKYVIYTQLGKAPREYPNADSMPQVQVALRDLAQGKTVRKGDVISYIVTTGSEPVAKRAYTPTDVLKADSGLTPDVDWYMAKQIFPPVERLCANIVGTSTAQLAENMGLDPRRYAAGPSPAGQATGGADGLDIHPLESQLPDEVRFANCARLQLRCRACKLVSTFEGIGAADNEQKQQQDKQQPESDMASNSSSTIKVTASGMACGLCDAKLSPISVVAQVEHAVRSATARYYEGWLVCDDTSCGARTCQVSVYGTRCLGPKGLALDCQGRMRYEFSERDIYNQLVYLASLFDVDRARARADAASASEPTRENLRVLAELNRARFATVKAVVDRYLDKCGRQWVAMDTLFAKLGFTAVA
ncbi:hypothetical protein RB597_002385 [Gaeumannomyces tritici]